MTSSQQDDFDELVSNDTKLNKLKLSMPNSNRSRKSITTNSHITGSNGKLANLLNNRDSRVSMSMKIKSIPCMNRNPNNTARISIESNISKKLGLTATRGKQTASKNSRISEGPQIEEKFVREKDLSGQDLSTYPPNLFSMRGLRVGYQLF